MNYTLPNPATPGTQVWAQWRPSGRGGAFREASLGSPAPGSQAGSGSFTALGLKVPQSVYLRLYTTNGPLRGKGSDQARIQGELPSLAYPTTVTGKEGGTSSQSSKPVTADPTLLDGAAFYFSEDPSTPLPPGLKVDAKTGEVRSDGQPLAAFDGAVTIRLMDFSNRAVYAPVRIQIAPQPPAPDKVTYADISAVVGSPVKASPTVGTAVAGYYFSPDLCTRFPGLTLDNRTGVIERHPDASGDQADRHDQRGE